MKRKHYDNHGIEEELYTKGYELIAGTDEVGRGPLVGPVVIAAVIMPKGCIIEGVTDSKKVPEALRKELSDEIKEKAIAYKIVFIDNEEIDRINILEASRLGMVTAVNSLEVKPDFVLTDAMELDIPFEYQSYIKGDEKSFTIACASILAKVARDEYMDELDLEYPEFEFKKNKGYPTKVHMEAIKKYGITLLHRRSYSPVRKQAELNNFYKK